MSKAKKKRNKKYNPNKHFQSEGNAAPLGLPAQIHEHIYASEPFVIEVDETIQVGSLTIERRKGTWIELNVDHPCGSANTCVALDVFEKVKKEPVKFIEQHIDLSYPHYLEWLEYGGVPRCSHIKNDGERCRNTVSGSMQKTPNQFMALHGGTCSVHGGIKSRDVEIFLHEKGVRDDRESFKQFYFELT